MASVLGYKACQDGYKVFYANIAKSMSSLKIAKVKGTILDEFKGIGIVDLLIFDDLPCNPSIHHLERL